ncbi:MAG: DoxX family membrane protein [Desulfobacterales bacterium]|nr:DoxX family membrane protein [Desulfobacterales bacterium]
MLFCRLFLAGVFIYASIDKIIHPTAFSKAVFNYQILPDVLINFTAITLPWVELVLGILLIFNIWMPGTIFISTGLLMIFITAIIFNLARGLDINCGCFSTSADDPMSALTMLRDFSFIIPAFFLLFITFKSKSLNQ